MHDANDVLFCGVPPVLTHRECDILVSVVRVVDAAQMQRRMLHALV